MRNTKIVHLSSAHPPFDVRIFLKECRTLAKFGYEVFLVVPHDQSESVDGVKIRPIPKFENRFQRITGSFWHVLKAAIAEDGSVYHFHDPELIPVGLILKLRGKCVIYDAHENLPEDILTKPYISPFLRKTISWTAGWIEQIAAKNFNGVVAATPSIGKRFSSKTTVIVQNFPNFHSSAETESLPYGKRPFQAVFIGGLTIIRGAKEMVLAMAKIPENLLVKLVLAVNFMPPELEGEVKKMAGWNRVEYVGWRTREEVAGILESSRMGLVLFHPVPNHLEAQPHKLFDYMSAGLPIIASDFPLWRQIIGDTGCGLLVNPLDPEAIAKAIQWILDNPKAAEEMGRRGQEAVRTHFNWENEGAKLLDLYQRLLWSSGTQDLQSNATRL